jgi:acyl-CoA dehydrogenase
MSSWRRDYLTRPLFAQVKRALPAISDTERQALEAGDVWWDAELLSGKPQWRKLLEETPGYRLSAEEQAFVDGPVQELCALIDDWQINFELRRLPPEVWTFLKRHRFFGMIIPKDYGGLGFSAARTPRWCRRSPRAARRWRSRSWCRTRSAPGNC